MASQQSLNTVQQLYIAYYQRPADPSGMLYWANLLDANGGSLNNIDDAFGNSPESQALYGPINSSTIGHVIDEIYLALFNRLPDAGGKQFYTDGFNSGRFSPASLAYDILVGAQNDDKIAIDHKTLVAQRFSSAVDGRTVQNPAFGTGYQFNATYAGNSDAAEGRQLLAVVTSDANSVLSTTQTRDFIIDNVANPGDPILADAAARLFTLREAWTAEVKGTPPVTALYWGYNPHAHDEGGGSSGPEDGGIPAADLLSFLTSITGLDFKELGLIDDDGVGPFDNVTSITLKIGDVDITTADVTGGAGGTGDGYDGQSGGNGGDASGASTLTIGFSDGTFVSAEAFLGERYLDFLHDLLFDAEGNSRLYEEVVEYGTPGEAPRLVPIKLTPFENNGGTVEEGTFTSNSDELIVAGRLELLHGAYIDASGGYDILEVDAKGTFAQPLLIRGVEEIRVENLPNVYTTVYGSGEGTRYTYWDGDSYETSIINDYLNNSLYPYVNSGSGGSGAGSGSGQFFGSDDSILDISRAIDIQKLVVNEGSFSTTDIVHTLGSLTVVGIRNGAEARLEGGFSKPVTLHWGQGLTGTLNLELALGDVTAPISLLQNAAVLNIDSQGVENHMHQFFAGGSVSRMVVTGTGAFGVDQNLASSFNQGRPLVIDASANTGGIDVTIDNELAYSTGSGGSGSGWTSEYTHYDVTVKGTQADDEITVNGVGNPADKQLLDHVGQVTIDAFGGDNQIIADDGDRVLIKSGSGADEITARGADELTITAGDGRNTILTDGSIVQDITAGSGNDHISARYGLNVTIAAGDGVNSINADQVASGGAFGESVVSITTGAGADTISAVRHDVVTIDAGNGANKIVTSANEVNITTGSGNDTVTISGMDTEFDWGYNNLPGDISGSGAGGFNSGNTDNYPITPNFDDSIAPGALLNVNLGSGANTLVLGRDVTDIDTDPDVDVQFGLTALAGSVVTGTGIKVFVENNSDLTEADLTGATITSVVLKQELRITADQFADIGAAAFSVLRDEEGATEDLYIVVREDVTLSSLVNLAQLSTNVRLHVELHDGATLTLSAAELHKYFAVGGIDSSDGLNGKVVITDAGLNFDAFTSVPYNEVIAGGTLAGNFASSEDVTIVRTITGFERPQPSDSTDTLTINSNVTPVVSTAVVSEVATLKIIGAADITFDKAVDLGRDATANGVIPAAGKLADGRYGDVESYDLDGAGPGTATGIESDAYTIDFTGLTGHLNGLVLANFQDVKQVKGNVIAGRDVRIDVELTNGSTVGAAGNANGLKSTGVQTYVVTAIGDDSVGEDAAASSATFYVCDLTKDIKVLGLQGNYNDTINFLQVNWGTNFLLEGGGRDKADGNPTYANIGNLHAEYFWSGSGPQASATVNIVNLDTAPIRPVSVAGIDIDNADTVAVTVAGASDLVVQAVGGNSVNNLNFTAAGNVTVRGDLLNVDVAKGLQTLDASAVVGTFTLQLSNPTTTDLSKTVVTGLEKVVFDVNSSALTLTVDQALAVGATNVTTSSGVTTSTLNFENLGNQAIDMTAFGAKNIGTVSIADNVGLVTLAPTTVLGNALNNADSLLIKAALDDTTVEMTAVQFNQLAGTGTVTSNNGVNTSTGSSFKATLVVTSLAANTKLDFAAVDQSSTDATPNSKVAVVVRAADVVATSALEIKNGSVTLEVSGNVDLTKATVANIAAIDVVKLAAGSVLTLTAAQVQDIGFVDADSDGIADNWSGLAGATLHITGISTGFNLDLTFLEKAGIDIGTLTLADSNGAIVLGAGANLANADSIVTPTKDLNDTVDGVEPTTLTLSAAQFNQLAGTGTITGDGKVFITGLANNKDANGDIVINSKDVAVIDVTGITAPKGTVDLGVGATSVTLDPTSTLAGFEIKLNNGQIIRFSTEAQASGAKITEVNPGTDVTAVAWLFNSITNPVNTSNYGGSINHLFITTTLANGSVEESLWTTLAQSIVVQKFSETTIPDVLTGFARINTIEALTSIPAGINYDNTTPLESTTTVTMNLEGNVTVGNVTVGDTGGTGLFQSLTINSYEDRSSLEARGLSNNNYVFQPNKIGNISLNAGSADNLVNVTVNTYANADNVLQPGDPVSGSTTSDGGFYDVVNVNAVVAERDGLAVELGTITFAATATVTNPTTPATLTLTGAKNITIAGVDISDAEVNILDINAVGHTGTLVIGAIAPVNGINDFGHIYVVDGFTAAATDVLGTVPNNDLLVVAGGANDLTKIPPANFDIDAVHFTQNGSLTLTAAQVVAIGTADGPDADKIADAWSMVAGLNVKLNITELDSATASMALDLVAAAGIDIGTITIKDTNGTVTIDPATNLGGADSIIVPAGTTLNLTAAQFDQLDGTGTISGLTATGQAKGAVNITNLVNTLDSNDLDTVADDYTFLDVTGITATHGTITLGANDVSVGNIADNVHSILGQFSITLNDIDTNATIDNELTGQIIRFSTAAQAERTILVTGPDNDAGAAWVPGSPEYFERDTSVIWLFNTITGTISAGKIQTNGYSGALGRVWVNDQLVNGQNVESIFSSPSAILVNPTTGVINLNSTTLIRVVNTADLATLLPENQNVARTVEVESFTQLPGGLIFNNPDKLVGVTDLTLDLGGQVNVGAVSIDDIVAAAIANNNEFGTLTINSKLAGSDSTPGGTNDHLQDAYLLPESFNPAVNPYPSGPNVLGNISSGLTRDELARLTINATGVGLNTGTVTFTDNGGLTPLDLTDDDPTAVLTLTGDKDVNIASVVTTDVDITALTVDLTGYTGTLTAPGTSPAFQVDNTQTLTFVNDGGAPEHPDRDTDGAGPDTDTDGSDGVVTLGTATNAGVAGNELSFINAAGYDGDLNLGVIAQIDSTNDDLNADGDVLDPGENIAFALTSGQGITTATLAAANGKAPTLNAGSEWSFDYTNHTTGSYLKLTPTVTLTGGSTLRLTNVPLVIEGAVSLSQLVDNPATPGVEGLIITGGSIEVLAGATLTLTYAQVKALAAATVDIVGAGTLKIVGDASEPASAFSLGANIKTVGVDITALTLIAAPAAGFDLNATVDITNLSGATVAGVAGLAQTVVGSANADAIATSGAGNDTFTGGAGNDTLTGGAGNDTYNVDAGSDTIVGLVTGDVLVVSAGATANAALGVASTTAGSFVATAATVNNGIAVLTDADVDQNSSIDMTLATGATGFTLIGGTGNAAGLDVLIGSSKADIINGGNTDQAAGSKDTLTGLGGADVFQFDVGNSTPVVLADSTTTPNVDRQLIQATAAATASGNLSIDYTVNGVASASPLLVAVVNGDTVNAVAAKIAAGFAGLAGFSGLSILDTASVAGPNGSGLSIDLVTPAATGVTTALANGTDVAQVDRVNIGTAVLGGVTPGEKYTISITLAGSATSISSTYTALLGDDEQDVAVGLATGIAGATATVTTSSSLVGGVWGVNITDADPDDGGFTIITSSKGGFNGSGASDNGATALSTADLITDFVSGTDKIDFGLVAGSASNYAEAVEVADYATALLAADTALNGVVQYYLTSIPDNTATAALNDATGLLFFDANSDGTVDGVVALTGINSGNFAFGDIIVGP